MKLERIVQGGSLGLLAGLWLTSFGCANSSVIADGTARGGRVFGEAGITGHKNTFTVERGSRIHHFSIIGDDNSVIVEEGAWIQKVEVWGRNNTVSVPADTTIRMTEVGKGNRIERRPSEWNIPALETAGAYDGTMTIRDASAAPTMNEPTHTAAPTVIPAASSTNYTAPPAGRNP